MNWISVNDRLPEPNQRVIAFLDAKRVPVVHCGGTQVLIVAVNFVAAQAFGNNEKSYAWVEGPMKWFGQDVTHWMPVPSNPGAD